MENIYFIIEKKSLLIPEVLSVCIEDSIENMRKSNNGEKLAFKLPSGNTIPVFLQSIKSFTHSQILLELSKAEWNAPSANFI